MAQLREQGSLSNVEVHMRRRDGTPVWVIENMTLLDGGVLEGTIVDITDRKTAQEQMEYQAYHDALTGLPNRLLFRDRIDIALAHAQAASHRRGGDVPRSRSIQARQRLPRSHRRRRAAAGSGARGSCSPSATTTPSRASAATSSRSCSPSQREPETPSAVVAQKDARGDLAADGRSKGTSSTSPPASASRCTPRTAPTRRRCCETPTARCTAPRKRAATTYQLCTRRHEATRGRSGCRSNAPAPRHSSARQFVAALPAA